MYILYTKDHCAFSAMVEHALEGLDLPYERRNIADPGVLDELIARGGKRQTPYFVDTDENREMYGSSEIVGYLMSQNHGIED